TGLALELSEHGASARELVVEDAPGHIEQVADQRVANGIANGRALLARDDHVLGSQDGELLGDRGLVEPQRGLKLLDAALADAQHLEESDPDRMRERLEEIGLEALEVGGRGGSWEQHSLYIEIFSYSQYSDSRDRALPSLHA